MILTTHYQATSYFSMLQMPAPNVNVSNPCLAAGVPRNYTIKKIFTNCVSGPDAEETFGFSLNPPPGVDDSTNVTFVGTGNITQCYELTKMVFDFYNCSSSGNCDSGKYVVPVVKGDFVVRGGWVRGWGVGKRGWS
jgi:hypothetical protein